MGASDAADQVVAVDSFLRSHSRYHLQLVVVFSTSARAYAVPRSGKARFNYRNTESLW